MKGKILNKLNNVPLSRINFIVATSINTIILMEITKNNIDGDKFLTFLE